MLRVLDLFSGIGGFSLGLERTGGFRTVAFCEIDPYCRVVLGERWPGVPVFGDIRAVSGRDVGAAEVICGGFPCQDISHAGRRAGIDGERSGLWSEYARLIGEVRPHGILCIWAAVNPDAPREKRGFWVLGTGNPIDHKRNLGGFVGTVQMKGGGLVWHVFEHNYA